MTAPTNDPAPSGPPSPSPSPSTDASSAQGSGVQFPPIPEPGPLPPSGAPPFTLPTQTDQLPSLTDHFDVALLSGELSAPTAYTVDPLTDPATGEPVPPPFDLPSTGQHPPLAAPGPSIPGGATLPGTAVSFAAASGAIGSPAPPNPRTPATLIVPFLVACLVAAGLGVYGKLHEPTGVAVNVAGFSSPATVKVWLATLAFTLAVVQLFTALVMYGKIQFFKNADWLGPAHRWSGRLAFLASIPVALHCLYALGFDDYSTRVLIHSLLGCFFYGTFAAKMLILSKKGVPSWALPLFGGLVFTALSGLFVTSALWFFTTFGVKL